MANGKIAAPKLGILTQFAIPAGHTIRLAMNFGTQCAFLLSTVGWVGVAVGLYHIASYRDSSHVTLTPITQASAVSISGVSGDVNSFDILNSSHVGISASVLILEGSVVSVTDITT